MSSTELEKVASNEVQDYIFAHERANVQKLLLNPGKILGLPSGILADQISARKKISTKCPLFYKTRGIIYPSPSQVEQSSSEATARFKVCILLKEFTSKSFQSVADLTGGFGIDSYFLSTISQQLDFVEPDSALMEIAKHNFAILGVNNLIFYSTTAEDFLQTQARKFDIIFIDPSRRDVRLKKVFRLSDCQPNVVNLLPQLFRVTKCVLLKASPLVDLQQGIRELIHVKKIFVIGVANECKELLFLLHEDFSGEPSIETYNLDRHGEIKHSFSFSVNKEKAVRAEFGEPQLYLYEPNASILKSGAFKLVGLRFGLTKLHPNTHLYTSSLLKNDFPGRVFRIDRLSFDSKDFPEKKANVITRNYPLKAEELRKKLKLNDGGENYVIGFSSMMKKYIVRATRLE